MSVRTPHLFLTAFEDGDLYSALADYRRFTAIDLQMHRVAEIIGDGVIDGWPFTQIYPNLVVGPGSGMVGNYCISTFSNTQFELSDDSDYYLYAKRRPGVIGGFGPRSNVVSVSYVDAGPPGLPPAFYASPSIDDPYFTVTLDWTGVTDVDLSHYEIQRSLNGVEFSALATVPAGLTVYADSVDENTSYTYRIRSVDLSSNTSSWVRAEVTTLLSPYLPPNPSEPQVLPAESAINVLWKSPKAADLTKVTGYEIEYVQLSSDQSEIPSTRHTDELAYGEYAHRFDGLYTNQEYKVTIRTVDKYDRKSVGFSSVVSPRSIPAPRDPIDFIIVQQQQLGNGLRLTVQWVDGANEYDPDQAYRYQLYIQVDGEQESQPITVPLGHMDERFEAYQLAADGDWFQIPQHKMITLRVTALTRNNDESFGRYLRFVTDDYSRPGVVSDLRVSFDLDRGVVDAAWANPSSYAYLRLVVLDEDLNTGSAAITLIDADIGTITRYSFPAQIYHKYTLRLTAYTDLGVAGIPIVAVVVTLVNGQIPDYPPLPALSGAAGDRCVKLTWTISNSPFIAGYRIYRTTQTISMRFSDYTLIEEVPETAYRFIDFGLTNNTPYVYYVTAVDRYGRESKHLPDHVVNLNFVQETPRTSGVLTEPQNLTVRDIGPNLRLTWTSLTEPFDAFNIYRAVNDLSAWELIASVGASTTTYDDIDLPMINGTTFYYSVEKVVNDAEIVLQTSSTTPNNATCLGVVSTRSGAFSVVSTTCRRIIKDLLDPITEYTTAALLRHNHTGRGVWAADRINLTGTLVITDWQTQDGRIYATTESIEGTDYILKVNGRFPSVVYTINSETRQIIFSEPIATVDPDTGEVTNIPTIEMTVLGVEEVQGQLDDFRFDHIHARQVAYGRIAKEQLPEMNHEGRIKESLLPRRFALQRYSDNLFIVPETAPSTRNFGDATTYFACIDHDGLIDEVIDWDPYNDGVKVTFNEPNHAAETSANLRPGSSFAGVSKDRGGYRSTKAYNLRFEFIDLLDTRWVKVVTQDVEKPNPVLDLNKRLRFRMLLDSGSVYVTLGIREIGNETAIVGSDGGTIGPVEWVAADRVLEDGNGYIPIGKLIKGQDNIWQEIEFDFKKEKVVSYDGGNGHLNGRYGVLDHIAFTIVDGSGPFNIYIDKMEQIDDVLVAGTSGGLQISDDFGGSWQLSRLTKTAVHKFYRASNNPFVWAISANEVFLATDPANWFETTGLTGVQFIRDITEDNEGNMYISTDKGVYWLEISLIRRIASWQQTQAVSAFTTDCYGLWWNSVSSGADELWVSTELGIFASVDQGEMWTDTGINTQGFPAYGFLNVGSLYHPILYTYTRKHILRKMWYETDFRVLTNFETQIGVHDIWKMTYFDGRLYVSSGVGVFISEESTDLASESITGIDFLKTLPELSLNNRLRVAFGLDVVQVGDGQQQLFIGQENRLVSVNTDQVLSVRKQFPQKDAPSFFVGNEEVETGFVYTTHNSVLAFREPQLVDAEISAAYLPRQVYFAIQGGWAHQNAEAEIFIYRNGAPVWIDFLLDNASILDVASTLQSQINLASALDEYNSLLPDAQTYLNATSVSISAILGDDNQGNPVVTRESITTLLDNYTRFLSLVTDDYRTANAFPTTSILLKGIARESRPANRRASVIEAVEGFESDTSLGISVDAMIGAFDFRERDIKFTKYDHLTSSMFGVTLLGTGIYSHIEVEDYIEGVNSGMPSNFALAHYTNMIKLGLHSVTAMPDIFMVYPVRPPQSKYVSGASAGWYDLVNSTIDYNVLLSSSEGDEARYVTCIQTVDDPYYDGLIWMGTDNGIFIVLINIDEYWAGISGRIEFPDHPLIKDIYTDDFGTYVIAQDPSKGESAIYKTIDYGQTWETISKLGLPNDISHIVSISGNLVVATALGVFYNDNNFGEWYPAVLVPTAQFDVDSDTFKAWGGRVTNLVGGAFLIVEIGRRFFTSQQGVQWKPMGPADPFDKDGVEVINMVMRFKNLTWLATDAGLYNDANSILSDAVDFSRDSGLDGNPDTYVPSHISDVSHGTQAVYCASSTGKIYRYWDAGKGSGNEWRSYEPPGVSCIHRIMVFGAGGKTVMLIVSHGLVNLVDITPETGAFE